MNKVQFIGRLTNSPVLSSKGTARVAFSLAVDRKFPDAEGNKITDFFNCICFGKKAETFEKYVTKGHKIFVEGELWNSSYENSQGEKKNYTNICVNEFEFLEKKSPDIVPETQPELTEINDDSLPF